MYVVENDNYLMVFQQDFTKAGFMFRIYLYIIRIERHQGHFPLKILWTLCKTNPTAHECDS